MTDAEDILDDSPAEFDSSFAYALHGEMRRLLVVTVLGTVLYPFGLQILSERGEIYLPVLDLLFGLALTVVGAAFLFGGIVAVLFKTIVDANTVAGQTTDEGSEKK
ncbi:MAG: hypothetical protein J07HX64_00417 [halophilic archaeon J07HX64]|jgi:hypothetical protein|nr:MAG: hypothetical protein J07HX64_00417 [halophilic archaeon J07HX64]